MPQVLYRKYRSQTFDEIYGQGLITKVLRQAVESGKVAHAYLFNGPRGTGKTSTARVLAKALNCQNIKNGEPCNNCAVCEAINENKFIDLIEIDAASNRGIDEIRALKEKVGFLPAEGLFKIYIIDEVHMLTIEAFNALLKTLEEPPKNVVFILATTEVHKLPLTIISRTQRFDFKLANTENLHKKLSRILKEEGIEFEEDALQIIIDAGNGSFRDAETVLEKVISSYGFKKDKVINQEDVEAVLGYASSRLVKEMFDYLSNQNGKEAIKMLNEAEKDGVNLLQLVKQLLELARAEMYSLIVEENSQYSMKFLSEFIREFTTASNALKFALIPILAIEVAIVRLTNSAESTNVVASTKPVVKSVAPKAVKQAEKDTTGSNTINVNKVTKVVSDNNPEKSKSEDKNLDDAQPVTDTIQNEAEGNVSVDLVKEKWDSILDAARKINPHLAAFLAKANIVGCGEGILNLEVPFALHKRSLEQSATADRFKTITSNILGSALIIKCEVNKAILNQEGGVDPGSNSSLVEEIFMG